MTQGADAVCFSGSSITVVTALMTAAGSTIGFLFKLVLDAHLRERREKEFWRDLALSSTDLAHTAKETARKALSGLGPP
jgi:hypothetical protein